MPSKQTTHPNELQVQLDRQRRSGAVHGLATTTA